MQVAGAHRRESGTAGGRHVNDSPAGQVALERSRRLFLDLYPCRIGNGCELAMQVVHSKCPFREPMPSEPSCGGGLGCGIWVEAAVATTAGSSVTSSRNVADGTKKRFPVTARLKSSSRS